MKLQAWFQLFPLNRVRLRCNADRIWIRNVLIDGISAPNGVSCGLSICIQIVTREETRAYTRTMQLLLLLLRVPEYSLNPYYFRRLRKKNNASENRLRLFVCSIGANARYIHIVIIFFFFYNFRNARFLTATFLCPNNEPNKHNLCYLYHGYYLNLNKLRILIISSFVARRRYL